MTRTRTAVVSLALALALAAGLGAAPAFAGDAAHGKKLFKKCKVCHTINKGGKKKIGPNLWDIVGRPAGKADGFKYSRGMRKAEFTWNDTTLDQWLTKPKKLVKGTKMSFPGFKKKQDRDDVIAYLKSQSD